MNFFSETVRSILRTTTNATLTRHTIPSVIHPISDENNHLDSSDERETNNHKVLLDALIVLLQRERNLLDYVFPKALQSLVFTKLIELPLTYMREEGQRLCQSVENSAQKLDTGKLAIYGIFGILQWFLTSRQIFAQLYQVAVGIVVRNYDLLLSAPRKVTLLVDSNSLRSRKHSNNR